MLRRRSVLGLGLGLGALAAGLLPPRPALAAAPRILILGDSHIAGPLGLALQRDLEAAGAVVLRQGEVSSGLARPDFFDWMVSAEQLVKAHQPQLSVCLLGGNDGQSLFMGRAPEGDRQWIRWGDEAWRAEYRRRIHGICDRLDQLVWIGTPQDRDAELRARVERINELIAVELAMRPEARFIDVWTVLAGPRGRYCDEMLVAGSRRRVRAPDGIHISPTGARVLADYVLPGILARL